MVVGGEEEMKLNENSDSQTRTWRVTGTISRTVALLRLISDMAVPDFVTPRAATDDLTIINLIHAENLYSTRMGLKSYQCTFSNPNHALELEICTHP